MPPIDARIITALRNATRVVILTGAGVSAESGIPTLRDKQTGLWEKFDAATLATPYAFEHDFVVLSFAPSRLPHRDLLQ